MAVMMDVTKVALLAEMLEMLAYNLVEMKDDLMVGLMDLLMADSMADMMVLMMVDSMAEKKV